MNQKLLRLVSGISESKTSTISNKVLSVSTIPQTLIDKLRVYSTINEVSKKWFDYLINRADFIEYPKGINIFNIGNQDNDHYFLLKGTIELIAKDGKTTLISDSCTSSSSEIARLKPRLYTAYTKSKVLIIKIEHTLLSHCLSNSNDDSKKTSKQDERKHLTFSRLITMLFEQQPNINVSKGQIILKEGRFGDYFYLIRKGKCQVIKYDHRNKKHRLENIIGEKQYFGEEALISGKKRNATIRMATNGVLARLDKKQFASLKSSISRIEFDQVNVLIDKGYIPIDVRNREEIKIENIEKSIHIPMNELRTKINELNKDLSYIVYCDTGNRSLAAAFIIILSGIENVVVLNEGLNYNENIRNQYTFEKKVNK